MLLGSRKKVLSLASESGTERAKGDLGYSGQSALLEVEGYLWFFQGALLCMGHGPELLAVSAQSSWSSLVLTFLLDSITTPASRSTLPVLEGRSWCWVFC